MILVVFVPFYPHLLVRGSEAAFAAAILFGAIPIGLILCLALHGCARINMRLVAREWRQALKYYKDAPGETVTEARKALSKKKRQRRPARGGGETKKESGAEAGQQIQEPAIAEPEPINQPPIESQTQTAPPLPAGPK